MIKLFLSWLTRIMKVSRNDIKFEIYIHKNSKNDINMVKRYWSKITSFPEDNFSKVRFKKHNIKTNRKNVGSSYYGGLRIIVRASSTMVRQITGWTEAIVSHI